jgi:hypothetical protein
MLSTPNKRGKHELAESSAGSSGNRSDRDPWANGPCVRGCEHSPGGQRSLAPVGVELSDEELLAVDGEFDPLTIASSMILWGGDWVRAPLLPSS